MVSLECSKLAYYSQPRGFTASLSYNSKPPQPRGFTASPSYNYYSQPRQPRPVFMHTSSSLPMDIFPRHPTPEEGDQIYLRALEESDGFDIPYLDGLRMCGQIQRVDLDSETDNIRNLLFRFSAVAIDHYNKHNGTSYRVVNVDKAMRQVVAGRNYYITFQAKTSHELSASGSGSGSGTTITKTFEALVYHSIEDIMDHSDHSDSPTEITLCRLQGDRKVSAEL